MERANKQPTFTDLAVEGLGSPRAMAFFATCEREIPFGELAASVADIFDDSEPWKGGAPHLSVVMMLKVVFIQKWFGLSDPMAEEMLRDRLSFRRFVRLSLDDKTPDYSTISTFRGRLLSKGHGSTLFDRTVELLRDRGFVMSQGTLIDATIIEAPRGTKRADGSRTTDPCATKTAKHGRGYHGYRAHIATDARGIITDFVYDTAAESEHTHFDHLAEPETRKVYADSGCRSKARVAALEARGVAANLCHRRVRGQAALTDEQRAFNRAVSRVRAVVEHPFAWIKRGMVGGGRARYRGAQRNGLDFALAAVAYNFRRCFTIGCALPAVKPG